MKIMLAAAAFSSEMSGVQRHGLNVVRCLLTRPEITAVHLVVAPWQHALVQSLGFEQDARLKVHFEPMGHTSFARNIWYAQRLPLIAKRETVDLVHLTYPVPVLRGAYSSPIVVTLHDLYPYEMPRNFSPGKVLFHRIILQQCLRNADAIACVSKITLQRLSQYMPAMRDKAVHIYNSVTPSQVATAALSNQCYDDSPFLLCVAQHRRNKNVLFALRVFQRALIAGHIPPAMRLVVVGLPGPESAKINRFVKSANLQHSVIFVDGISDAELGWCYRNCQLLLAPSLIEGFGLPVLEARLAGCRVVCSDIPAFREVGSTGCRFVALRPGAEEDFALALAETLQAPRSAGVTAPEFSPSVIAEKYMALYREVLARQGNGSPSELMTEAPPPQGRGRARSSLASRILATLRL